MSTIIDCIKSLADIAAVMAVWFGAAGLMWLRDELAARREKRSQENAKVSHSESTP
jgi:hypothetical protein